MGDDLRSRQEEWRGCLALKLSVHKHPVLAVAVHVEMWRVVVDLEVPPRNEARVAHVHVHVALAAVAADGDAVLANHVLELARLESGNGRRGGAGLIRRPLVGHLRGTGGRRLEGQQRPGVLVAGRRVGVGRRRHGFGGNRGSEVTRWKAVEKSGSREHDAKKTTTEKRNTHRASEQAVVAQPSRVVETHRQAESEQR